MYMRRLMGWGASVSRWHPFAASRWRRASRVPSATASHPTRSPLQPSSSWRSAAAMSVGSVMSKGPWVSPSRDRASSYTRPPALKCATASWAAPSSWGVPSDGGRGMSPFAYLRSPEYVGGVKDDAGGDGRPDE